MYILTDERHIVFYISDSPRFGAVLNSWHEYPNYNGEPPNLGDFFIPGRDQYVLRTPKKVGVKTIPKGE